MLFVPHCERKHAKTALLYTPSLPYIKPTSLNAKGNVKAVMIIWAVLPDSQWDAGAFLPKNTPVTALYLHSSNNRKQSNILTTADNAIAVGADSAVFVIK